MEYKNSMILDCKIHILFRHLPHNFWLASKCWDPDASGGDSRLHGGRHGQQTDWIPQTYWRNWRVL